MSAAPQATRALTTQGAAAHPLGPPGRPGVPALAVARRLGVRLVQEWLPRVAWTIGRTGRAGLAGLALLLAAGLFLISTHLEVVGEVESLRADLADAQRRPGHADATEVARPTGLPPLPPRTAMPAVLRQLFDEARRARLSVDTGKYELDPARAGGLARYRISFPVTGPYPQVRAFLDGALAALPEVALEDLVLERKSIADGTVEAQIRMAVYASATGSGRPEGAAGKAGPPASPLASAGPADPDRVVEPTHAAALFAPHSWYVPPPPRPRAPPPPPPPEPEPTAPPFPYRFVGSYAPQGALPVYFLARGDRVIDAHVGDRLDGVYQFESVSGGQLVFLYMPLNLRQSVPAGASN